MTAHRVKPTITPERVEWFARYLTAEPAWGVFHVSLEDGNYNFGAATEWIRPGTGGYFDGEFVPSRWDMGRDEWPADVRDAAEWFDRLSMSQRQRLGRKAGRKAGRRALDLGVADVVQLVIAPERTGP